MLAVDIEKRLGELRGRNQSQEHASHHHDLGTTATGWLQLASSRAPDHPGLVAIPGLMGPLSPLGGGRREGSFHRLR